MKKILFWFVLIWGVVAGAVYVWVGQENPEALLGVAMAAGLSGVITFFSLMAQWEGTVEEIRVESVHVSGSDEDDPGYNKDVRFAYIRLANGKRKKKPAMPQWQQGTQLRKQRGKFGVEVVG